MGPLFRLWLKVTLLTLLTLGVYRFWAHTRLRKYLWSRIVLDGERFEYDGTGGELFRRFLFTLLVLAPLLFAQQIAQLAGASPTMLGTVVIAQAATLLFLASFGYYSGRRYRLGRTTWCGIRGWLDGHSGVYALYAVLTLLAMVLTLGLYTPWRRVILWRYEARHTVFGDGRFAFAGRGRDLVRAMATSILLFVVALAAVLLAASLLALVLWMLFRLWTAIYGGNPLGATATEVKTILTLIQHKDWGTITRKYANLIAAFVVADFVVLFLFSFLFQAAFQLGLSRFRARWFNYMAEHTRFEGVRLSASVSTWPMFKLLFGNMLLQILTLGLGRIFVAHRLLRFACTHLTVTGLDSLRELRQTTTRERPPASGLAQLLDTGGFT